MPALLLGPDNLQCAAHARQQAEGLERTRAFLPCITLSPTPSFAGCNRRSKSGSALRGWSARAPSSVYYHFSWAKATPGGAAAHGGAVVQTRPAARILYSHRSQSTTQTHSPVAQAAPGERRRVQGLERTRALLQRTLHGLQQAGWPPRRVHLFGFSQGGTAVLDLALHCR